MNDENPYASPLSENPRVPYPWHWLSALVCFVCCMFLSAAIAGRMARLLQDGMWSNAAVALAMLTIFFPLAVFMGKRQNDLLDAYIAKKNEILTKAAP